jgi:hypothetical protein
MNSFKFRGTFEIIFDSCSSGDKVLRALKLLAKEAVNTGVFNKYKFIAPLQIGTEIKQVLFKDILEKELLTDKPGRLHKFYKENDGKIKFAESDVSHSFKFYFAYRAFSLFANDQFIRQRVIFHAHETVQKFFPELLYKYNKDVIDTDFDFFKMQIIKKYKITKLKIAKRKEKIEIQLRNENYSPEYIYYKIQEAELKMHARAGKKFFERSPESYKFIVQAFYSNNSVTALLNGDEEFKKFRTNKGERAIESYLMKKLSIEDETKVTVVVSEDNAARKSIQAVRRKSGNTIFILSSYGLAFALKKMDLIMSFTDVIDQAVLDNIQKRRKKTEEKLGNGKTISSEDILEPEVEEKWADRLIEIIKHGTWK